MQWKRPCNDLFCALSHAHFTWLLPDRLWRRFDRCDRRIFSVLFLQSARYRRAGVQDRLGFRQAKWFYAMDDGRNDHKTYTRHLERQVRWWSSASQYYHAINAVAKLPLKLSSIFHTLPCSATVLLRWRCASRFACCLSTKFKWQQSNDHENATTL